MGRDTTPKVHSLRNPKACQECHVDEDGGPLREPGLELCLRCHPRVGLSAEAHDSPGLVLDAALEKACMPCHDPHGKD